MIINGKSISLFNGTLYERTISPAVKEFKKEFMSINSLAPVKTVESAYQYKIITASITISASSIVELEALKGLLVAELKECDIVFTDITGVTYSGYLTKNTWDDTTELIGDMKIELSVIAHGSQISKAFTDNLTFTYEGNTEAPAVLEITPSVSLTTLTISGLTKHDIVVNNVSKDAPLIIDGEACLITQAGSNKFGDATMWEFPSVKPGNNTVTLSTACTAILKYKPRFI